MSKKNAARNSHAELKKEVSALARQVVAIVQDPVVRSEVKGIGGQALRSLRATGSRIARALHKAKESEATRHLKSRAKRVYGLGKREGGKTAQRVSADLVTRLKHVSAELQKLSRKLHK